MSAISSVGSSSQGSLYLQQLLQQRAQNDHDQDDGAGSVGGAQGTPQGGFAAAGASRFQARFAAAAKAVGVDPAKIPDLEKQIQTAVQQVKDKGTASGADQRSAIQDAINGVLKNNGIDPAKFQAALKSAGGAHKYHGGHHRPQTATDSTQNSATTSNSSALPLFAGQTSGTQLDVAA